MKRYQKRFSENVQGYEQNLNYFEMYFDKLFAREATNMQALAGDLSDAIFSAMLKVCYKKYKDDKIAEDKASKLALFLANKFKYLHSNNPQQEVNEPISTRDNKVSLKTLVTGN